MTDSGASSPSSTVVFAGGGSGGHLTPGLAIAEALSRRRPNVRSIFACSDRPIDATVLSAEDATFVPIPARPPSLRPGRLLAFARGYRTSVRAARAALREHEPAVVVALGGFVAVPVVRAARREGIPAVLMNLDDPPGKANRWLARSCTHIWSAVPVSGRSFTREITGMPIRQRALAPDDVEICRTELGIDPSKRVLLITGASQGATSVNRFMQAFIAAHGDVLADWHVLHLAGDRDQATLETAYSDAGIDAQVLTYLPRMGLAWGSATVAISRAGASSVAEASANAVPTMYFPYPYHRDQHQARNAFPVVEAGAAMLASDHVDAEVNLRAHGPRLIALLSDEVEQATMIDILVKRLDIEAADRIATRIEAMLA
ncbi:MAG: UDP-N-acetylglucosamine--N-acetylmuramyl-(pentapeptide) pyrophosphoryl-undecaprenol N-acetylglucosamine transferase [Planctomycetota bacterium]